MSRQPHLKEPGMSAHGDTTTSHTRPQWLSDLAISDTGFIFDPYSGATYNVNATGLTILKGIREGIGRTALLERLADLFDVAGRDVDRDLDEFVHVLRQRGLVPQHFSLEG
ncbi:MAG: PqqD family protein [Myxococcota bacterium]